MSGSFTKESLDAVADVFASITARLLKHFPDWDFATVSKQIDSLQSILANMSSALGAQHFVIEITQDDDSAKSPLSAKAIIDANTERISIIRVGKTLNIVSRRSFTADSPTPVELSDASQNAVLFYREANNAATVYAKGCTVGHFDLASPNHRPPTSSQFARRAEDYERSILDHYRENVRYGQSTDHWEKRPERILFALKGTAKTEEMFHRDLHHWLEKHLQAQVWRGAKDTTRDALDILIASPRGRTYLIEVKWMGENKNGTKYTIKDISKGLGQLKTYLTKQTKVKRGTLVAYDGRSKSEFDALASISDEQTDGCKRLEICNEIVVPERGSCLILFLENKTASE